MMAPDATRLGTIALDAELAGPVPAALVAVTLKVYEVPLVRAVTIMGEEPPLAVIPPGLEVTP
jgi:hypothetical protein